MARSVFLDFIDGYENVYTENGRKLSTGKRFFSRSYSGTMTKRKNTPSLFRLTAKLSDIEKVVKERGKYWVCVKKHRYELKRKNSVA